MARVLEAQILQALNEGKDELVKLIRQSREDWFLTTVSGTISAAAAPNYSSLALPADFAEIKELMITRSGYEGISFAYMDRSDPRFKNAQISGSTDAGDDHYYDLVGVTTMVFAPGFSEALPYTMTYIATVADMTKRSDTPALPAEHHRFIITWAVADVLRSLGDPRLSAYDEKLAYQRNSVIEAVNSTDIKEPRFARAFDEDW